MGLSCPRKTGGAAEITGEPGSTRRRVGGEGPDSEWPGEMFIKEQRYTLLNEGLIIFKLQ